jgi:hypothetical protein
MLRQEYLFFLAQRVDLFTLSDLSKPVNSIVPVQNARILNLSQTFTTFWQEQWNDYLKESDRIYFTYSESAGFGDLRTIFIWLQTWKMFYPEKTFLIGKQPITSTLEIARMIKEGSLSNNFVTNPYSISYHKQPRIGKIN